MVVAATPPPTTAPAVSSEPEVRRAVPVSAALPRDATATDVAPRVEPVVGGPGSARATGLAPATASAAPAGETGVRTYKVESGDTLAGIARKYYKNSGQWQKIAEANKATLSDPTKLKPGMILVIP
jgi:nucleoid-associated protein YgaU